jgi:hypothetical protein
MNACDTKNPIPLTPTTLTPVPVPVPPPAPVTAISNVLGAVHRLTDTQKAALDAYEDIIRKGWVAFVEVGVALAKIRAEELYLADYPSFEAYCQDRWDFQRTKVYHLIAAARVYKCIEPMPGLPKPEHESQLRPLFGLAPESIQLAWQCAVVKSGPRPVTARLVRSVINELHLASQGDAAGVSAAVETRKTRTEQRRAVTQAFGELFQLIRQKAAHDTLLARLEALHGLVSHLFCARKVTN